MQRLLQRLGLDPDGLLGQLRLALLLARLGKLVVDPLAFLDLPRRERALTRFAASQYFRRLLNQEGGEPASECDAAVNQILGDEEAPAPGGGAK